MDTLTLRPEIAEALFAHTRAWFPRECCGVILGQPDAPTTHRFVPFDNLQDQMHARDPQRFPRDARTAFYLDPLQLERLIELEQRGGGDLVAIVHSHPGHPAYFSSTDRAAASPFGFPSYPQAWHLVISVYEGEIRDLKGFRWDENGEVFRECRLEGLPPLPGPPPGAREYQEESGGV